MEGRRMLWRVALKWLVSALAIADLCGMAVLAVAALLARASCSDTSILRGPALVLAIPLPLLLAHATWMWHHLRTVLPYRITDISAEPEPLPESLEEMEREIREVGFRYAGQWECVSRSFQGNPRHFGNFYVLDQDPRISVGLDFVSSRAEFTSVLCDGRLLSTCTPRIPLPRGARPNLPAWHRILQTDDGIRSAMALHMSALGEATRMGAIALPRTDFRTMLAHEDQPMARISQFFEGSAASWYKLVGMLVVVYILLLVAVLPD
jgi:hypothetical protein